MAERQVSLDNRALSREIGKFVEEFRQGLDAYGRAALHYPAGHRQLRDKETALCEAVVSFVRSRRRPLFLQVREGTIYSENRAVTGDPDEIERLAVILRERGVQLLCVLPTVQPKELMELADLLISYRKPRAGGCLEFLLGPNITVYLFPPTVPLGFDEAISESEIVARAQRAQGDDPGVQPPDEGQPAAADRDPHRGADITAVPGAPDTPEPFGPAPADVLSGWEPPDLSSLREEFSEFMNRHRYLVEYTQVATDLVLRNEESESEISETCFKALKNASRSRLVDRSTLKDILGAISWLPNPVRVRWELTVFRLLVPAGEVLQTLSGDNALKLKAHLEHPPVPLNAAPANWREDFSSSQEVLRQILRRGDDYAMDVVSSVLLGPHGAVAAKYGWVTLLKEVSGMHRSLHVWVERRAAKLCTKRATVLLGSLPFRQLYLGLKSRFGPAGVNEQMKFIAALERLNTPEATRLLTIAFEFRYGKVRRVALGTIAAQRNPEALKILIDVLKKYNEDMPELAEVNQICGSLAAYHGAQGRKFLDRICTERKGFLHVWRRSIRQAARRALEEAKIARGSSGK